MRFMIAGTCEIINFISGGNINKHSTLDNATKLHTNS